MRCMPCFFGPLATVPVALRPCVLLPLPLTLAPPHARRLLPSLPPRAGEYAASWLAERGVEVLTGHTLDLADWEEVGG